MSLQLNQFQTAHMSLLAERRTQAMNMYRMDYERQCAMQQNYGQVGKHPLIHVEISDQRSQKKNRMLRIYFYLSFSQS